MNTPIEKIRFLFFLIGFVSSILVAQDEEIIDNKSIKSFDIEILEEFENTWREKLKSSSTLFETSNDSKNVVSEVSQKDLRVRLEMINQSTPMDLGYNTVVHGYVERYLRMGHAFDEIMGLAEYYFPLFEEILSKYDIPEEIKYLAIVESKLDTKAISKSGAKGLWQFMYATGKAYGLEVNSYVDERYDPIKSTEAAVKYLSYLYKNLGDWDLALASYNAGMGNVNKAVRRSGGHKNYWNIRPFLPKETRGYIPSFVGANYLFAYYREHKIPVKKPRYSFFDTDTIHVQKKLTFKELSLNLDMSIEEIKFLNPQYKIGVIPKVSGKTYYLRLPKTKVKVFTSNEDIIYDRVKVIDPNIEKPETSQKSDQSTPQKYDAQYYYIVKAGDSLYKISKKYKISISELMRINSLKSTSLRIGQPLRFKVNSSS